MIVLETIGTIIKPISLSLRLYGNTFGEDKLLASFLGMGMILSAVIFKTSTPWIGVPLHFPFMFLALLVSVIQSTVFALLTAVYIALLLPHEHHEEGEGHESAGHEMPAPAAARAAH
jgi:F-type H+-transporting ATPase subunit a